MRKAAALALEKLLPFQREDFVALFRIMAGLPVTIRLLDPPLHEFLPHGEHELAEIAAALGVDMAVDAPPSRLGSVGGQSDARPSRLPPRHHLPGNLRDAGAGDLRGGDHRRRGNRRGAPVPEIMIPLVGSAKRELEITRAQVDRVAKPSSRPRGGGSSIRSAP